MDQEANEHVLEASPDHGEQEAQNGSLNFDQIEFINSYIKRFSTFGLSNCIKLYSEECKHQIFKDTVRNKNIVNEIYSFYKYQSKKAEYTKDHVSAKLKDIGYSMNNLSLIAKYFESYSNFKHFCENSKIALENDLVSSAESTSQSSYKIFEKAVFLEVLEQHQKLPLNLFLCIFKRFALVRRREILNIAVNHLVEDIQTEKNSIPFINNTKSHILSELSRLSSHLGIHYDIQQHDGQHFIYNCEKVLKDYQRMKFVFKKVEYEYEEQNMIDCMNKSFLSTHTKNDLFEEAFNNVVEPHGQYEVVVFNALNNKELQTEQIQALVNLRFCRNRQLLLSIEKTVKCIGKSKRFFDNLIDLNNTFPNNYSNDEMNNHENASGPINDNDFEDKYISLIIDQTIIFGSAIFLKNEKEIDLDNILEICLEMQFQYAKAKSSILQLLVEISKHCDPKKSVEITEIAHNFILMKPNLLFSENTFFESFKVQIGVLEMINKTLSLLTHLQLAFERQLSLFFGSFYDSFFFGNYFSQNYFGETGVSHFETYPSLERILDFIQTSPYIVNQICSTMLIKSNENSNYIELAVWTQLFEEISHYPEQSIFSYNFSSIHFNMPLSKDVESLVNCSFIDDPGFISKLFSDMNFDDNERQSIFYLNFWNFVRLSNKLRRSLLKTNVLLPLYIRQLDEKQFSCGSSIEIAFKGKSFDFASIENIKQKCIIGNFTDLEEMIIYQKRYNVLLKIAIQYNNFRSDNYFSSFLFNIDTPNNSFFITKQIDTKDKVDNQKNLQLHEAANRLFVNVKDIIDDQDFSSIFFDINEIEQDFNAPQSLYDSLAIFLQRIELAVITCNERISLFDFTQTDQFSFVDALYNKVSQNINYFCIPSIVHCLTLECEDFSKILHFVSMRFQEINRVKFDSFISHTNAKFFELLYKHELLWESSFFSKLGSNSDKCIKNLGDMNLFLENHNLYQTDHLNLSIILLLGKIYLTKPAYKLVSANIKPSVLSQVNEREVRDFWCSVNKKSSKNEKYIFAERYSKNYLLNLCFSCADKMKSELINVMGYIDNKIEENVVSKESSYQFLRKMYENEIYKFVILHFINNATFSDINENTFVSNISRRIYKDLLPVYTNFVFNLSATHGIQDEKKGDYSQQLELINSNSIIFIREKIEKELKMRSNKEKAEREQEIEDNFASPHSPTKPECYAKKKYLTISSDKVPFNPNPQDIEKQFKMEVRYLRCKLIFMIVDAVKSTQFEKSGIETSKLVDDFKPLSNIMNRIFNKSIPQLLKTWICYASNMKNVTCSLIERDLQLSTFVKAFKQRYNRSLSFELKNKLQDQFLSLCNLRDKERSIKHEQISYEKEVTNEIKDQYKCEQEAIKKEQQEVLKQFPQVHNSFFSTVENVVDKQKKTVPEKEAILQANNEIAEKSLQFSKISQEEQDQIKLDDIRQQEMLKKEEDRKILEDEQRKKEMEIKHKDLNSVDFLSMKILSPNGQRGNVAPRKNPALHASKSTLNSNDKATDTSLTSSTTSFHHEIVKSQTMTFFDIPSNSNEEKEENESNISLIPKRHFTSTISSQNSQLILSMIQNKSNNNSNNNDNNNNNYNSDSNNISNNNNNRNIGFQLNDSRASFENEEKFVQIKGDIKNLRKEIIKERVTQCLFRIGTRAHFNKVVSKIANEKKEASMILWNNHRTFEEETREIENDLRDSFKRLTVAEAETERLKSEVDAEKVITTKLSHWKDLSMRTSDEIIKKIGVHQKGPNVDVNKLLGKLEEKQRELDDLIADADEFERQLVTDVREPMEEIAKIRKLAQQTQYETLLQANNTNDNVIERKIKKDNAEMLCNLTKENEKFIESNRKLKDQINELENQMKGITPLKLESAKQLLLNQPPMSAKMKTSFSTYKRSTALTPRSPYVNIGQRSIKKPMIS